VEFAHEFCYRNCPLEKNTVLLVLSQSGETADTLAALREAKRRGHRALAIVNVVGSTIAREADGGIYMHAGPEIGVASTKAFVSTLTDFDAAGGSSGPAAAAFGQPRAGNSPRARSPAEADRKNSRARRRAEKTAEKYAARRRISFSSVAAIRFPSRWKAR
jgi:fructoselysine-6-P-deglycase FrlB-like protein